MSNNDSAADVVKLRSSDGRTRTSSARKWAEIGSVGLDVWSGFISEAYNAKLEWPTCYPLFNRIRRSDPEIAIVRQLFTALARRVQFRFEPGVEDPGEADELAVTFGNEALDDLDGGLRQFIDTLVSYVPFMGWGYWEVVPGLRRKDWRPPDDDPWRSKFDDGRLGIRRLAWRDHSSFKQWSIDEATNRLYGMVQHDHPNDEVTIPLDQSVHMIFGDAVNPEGLSPLEAVWRLERIKYGLEIVQGIGFEHNAGYLDVTAEKDKLTNEDHAQIQKNARAILSATEGNFAAWPKGFAGKIVDVGFEAADSLLGAIQYYGVLKLQVFMMHWVALSTTTGTGSYAAKSEDTTMFVLYFNAMMEGFAEQLGQQLAPWLFDRNIDAFPGLEQKPKLVATKLDKTVDLGELTQWVDTLLRLGFPLADQDMLWIRERSGMPEVLPTDEEMEDEVPDSQDTEEQDEDAAEDAIDEEDVRGALASFQQFAGRNFPRVARILGAPVYPDNEDDSAE